MGPSDPSHAPADHLVVDDPVARRTWVVDAAFLRSHHRCIYGEGCQGIGTERAPELAQGCCSVGAQLVDEDDVATVVRSFVRLGPTHMQHHDEARREGFLVGTADGSTATRLVDGACIFLNRPGFEGGTGCALHLGALADGDRPLDRKPNVCWQLPLRVEELDRHDGSDRRSVTAHDSDDRDRASRDRADWVTVSLRRWRRDDWGGPLAWWCTEPDGAPEAFGGGRPVYEASRDEIVEIVGEAVYERLAEELRRPGGGASG